MLPIETISGNSLDAIILYLSIIGMLLLLASWLRLKIPIFKKYFIPASLIAGVIGLLLGPNVLRLFPSEITSCWSSLGGKLIVFVYAPLLMRKRVSNARDIARSTMARGFFAYFESLTQYAVPLLLCVFVLTPIFDVPGLFGVIVEEGWCGGHGTAGGMTSVFEELGWADGPSLAVTSATIGLFFGIIGGVILLNLGVRRGWTDFLKDTTSLQNTAEEIYAAEEAPIGAKNVTSSNVIDSFAFHMALISVAVFLGYLLNKLIKQLTGLSIAWYICALFCGLFVKKLLGKSKWADAIDNHTINRIQGCALDFLIAGSVASVNIPVVLKYAMPLLIQQLVMFVVVLWIHLWLCRRIYPKHWFEQSIHTYGTMTGVAAVGLLLLRMADPDMESGALETTASVSPFTGWATGGGVITSLMPVMIVRFGTVPVTLAVTGLAILFFILMRLFTWVPAKEPPQKAS